MRMRSLQSATVLLVTALAYAGPIWAQEDDFATVAVGAASVREAGNAGRAQLDLYAQIPYNELRFVSGPLGFTARYQVSAAISAVDDLGRPTFIVQSPIWERSVTVAVFAQTESTAQRDITTRSVLLEPGTYLVSFEIDQLKGGEVWFSEFTVTVRDFDRPMAVSDIVLLDSYDPETKTMTPHVSDVLSGSVLAFEVYFEVYADRPRILTLIRELRAVVSGPSIAGGAANQPAPVPVYSDTSQVEVQSGRNQLVSEFPAADLGVGRYLVRIQIEDGALSDVSERAVVSQWTGLSLHLGNLDEAIDQMVYAATRRELQAILSGATEAERRRRFDEFWERRDPTPETERNERLEEYYYRVSVANRRFSSVRPGWQTDRGHVLILHGNPDDTHRQTFSFNAEPYEVWYYYRIGRQYVFVDETGFGDYELLVPVWDERTRMR